MFNSRWLTLTESVSGSSPTFLVLPPPSSRRRPQCPLLHPCRPTPPVRAESQLNLRRLARRADGIMRSFPKRTTIAPWSFALTEPGINSTLMYVNQLLASCSLPSPPSFPRGDRIPTSSTRRAKGTAICLFWSEMIQKLPLLVKNCLFCLLWLCTLPPVPVHIAVKERQQMVYYQACTSERPSGMVLLCCHQRLESAHVSKHGPGFFTPVFEKMSKMLDNGRGLEPR